MTKVVVYPSLLQGKVSIPPSKSETMRAILFAALAEGKSTLLSLLDSPDVFCMYKAVESFGAKIVKKDPLQIEGVGGKLFFTQKEIYAGNSGIVARFLTPLCALKNQKITILGDESIAKRRPVQTLLQALEKRGAKYKCLEEEGHFPFWIEGPFSSGRIEVEGKDSQVVSALLIAASIMQEPLEIFVKNPGETPWVEMTLSWLKRIGIAFERKGYSYFKVQGRRFSSFTYSVPADFSSAAFMAVSSAIKGEVTFLNLCFSEVQGDKILFSWLKEMGVSCFSSSEGFVVKSAFLKGGVFDINEAIDALPILAVLGCFTEKGILLKNAAVAREKESDRLEAISQELKKMGAEIKTGKDFLHSFPSQLQGAILHSHKDHRIAMALIIAALSAKGKSEIEDIDCIQKSYPKFLEELQKLGAKMEVIR